MEQHTAGWGAGLVVLGSDADGAGAVRCGGPWRIGLTARYHRVLVF